MHLEIAGRFNRKRIGNKATAAISEFGFDRGCYGLEGEQVRIKNEGLKIKDWNSHVLLKPQILTDSRNNILKQ